MNIQLTLRYDAGFDIQKDVHLEQGHIDYSEGPDRAYLLFPFEERGIEYDETVGLWLLDDAESCETLAAVLSAPDPRLSQVRPWYVNWIKDGQMHVRRKWLGVDRGAHLLAALSDYDLLDRPSHIFGIGP